MEAHIENIASLDELEEWATRSGMDRHPLVCLRRMDLMIDLADQTTERYVR
jgi:hypothetical protein